MNATTLERPHVCRPQKDNDKPWRYCANVDLERFDQGRLDPSGLRNSRNGCYKPEHSSAAAVFDVLAGIWKCEALLSHDLHEAVRTVLCVLVQSKTFDAFDAEMCKELLRDAGWEG